MRCIPESGVVAAVRFAEIIKGQKDNLVEL